MIDQKSNGHLTKLRNQKICNFNFRLKKLLLVTLALVFRTGAQWQVLPAENDVVAFLLLTAWKQRKIRIGGIFPKTDFANRQNF